MRPFVLFAFITIFPGPSLAAQSPAAAWSADIAVLRQELPKRHPNLFAFYPQHAFESDLDQLLGNLEGKTDLQVALELQAVVAKAQDANTRIDLAPLLQQNKVIPTGFGWYADGMYVSGTVKKFAPALGKKVLEINGLKTEAALERMRRFFACENEEAQRRDGPQWLRFPEAMRMAGVATDDTLRLLMADEKGQKYFIKTYPVDFKTDKTGLQPAQFVPKSPDLRWDPLKQIYSLVWLASDSIVYLQYNAGYSSEMFLALGDSNSARQVPSFQPLADSLLNLLENHPGARFFFDLRFNNTGYPADGIALAERLGAMPFVNLPDRLYVALNRYTSGAAVEIAAAFKAKTNATLLGETPPQRPNHFGDPQMFQLPNSHLQVHYSTRAVWILPGNASALPIDVPIELPFAAFRDGRDPVLDYVRRL